MRRKLAFAALLSAFGASFATAATNGSTAATTHINAVLSPVSVEIAADTEKLYDAKSSNIIHDPIVAASAPGYVWVSLGERASRTKTAHCLPASPYGNGYVFYAAIARASSGSLDWRNVHAVILTGSTYFELLIRGPDKLIVGARTPAADSWSVVSQSREHIDPTLQYSVEVSDSPEPRESRLTL